MRPILAAIVLAIPFSGHAGQAAQQQKPTNNDARAGAPTTQPPSASDTGTNRERANKDANETANWSGWATATIASAQVGLFIWQLISTRKTINDTRKNANAAAASAIAARDAADAARDGVRIADAAGQRQLRQLRPYLNVRWFTDWVRDQSGNPVLVRIHAEIRNVGQTPALKLCSQIQHVKTVNNEPPTWTTFDFDHGSAVSQLAPGGDPTITADSVFTGAELHSLSKRQYRLFVRTDSIYRNLFEERQRRMVLIGEVVVRNPLNTPDPLEFRNVAPGEPFTDDETVGGDSGP